MYVGVCNMVGTKKNNLSNVPIVVGLYIKDYSCLDDFRVIQMQALNFLECIFTHGIANLYMSPDNIDLHIGILNLHITSLAKQTPIGKIQPENYYKNIPHAPG